MTEGLAAGRRYPTLAIGMLRELMDKRGGGSSVGSSDPRRLLARISTMIAVVQLDRGA